MKEFPCQDDHLLLLTRKESAWQNANDAGMTQKDTFDIAFVKELYQNLDNSLREAVDQTIDAIVTARQQGGSVVVVTGSGPNIHEGVTTLIAELIQKGIVGGVSTSAAVVAHEMAGSLERVKRVDGARLGLDPALLPKGEMFEINLLAGATLETLQQEMVLDTELLQRVQEQPGQVLIKAAGNMAYPLGLRTERLALEVEALAQLGGHSFEHVAGLGGDPHTMIGAGALKGVPVLVSVPQLIGGGMVGLCIGDSISLKQRSARIARMLAEASVIIESGVALTQEIHDGPFETYTGHGIWSAWEGMQTFSLSGKTLARIDLDPNLEKVWQIERGSKNVQQSIDQGLPKAKTLRVPFRMEMSGFARLEGSIPLVGDLGVIWPILAWQVAERLGIALDFLSYPQESAPGQAMREWIVENVGILDRKRMKNALTPGPSPRLRERGDV
jgi:hypothetical protein